MKRFVYVLPFMGECCTEPHAQLTRITAPTRAAALKIAAPLADALDNAGFFPARDFAALYRIGEIDSHAAALKHFKHYADRTETK